MWTPTWGRVPAIVTCCWTFLSLSLLHSTDAALNNRPPRFLIDGQTEIVLRLKEGSATPVGSLIYRLRGFDPDGDPLTFGVREQAGYEVLRIVPANDHEALVYLRKELDRELRDEYALVLTLTDGRLGEGNFITQSLLLLVEDVNDNAPVFKPYQASINIREDSPPRVLAELEATDLDEGPYGQVVYTLEQQEDDEGLFSVSTVGGRGVVRLIGQLDYERKFLYQLRVLATDRSNNDRVNTGTAALLVRVEDVEDQPPEFTLVPPVTRVSEDVRVGTPIFQVRAVDGDRGVNNRITYSVTRGAVGIFGIDARSGVVYTLQKLDREGPSASSGAYILEITAKEESRALQVSPSVSTEATVMVMDVNDEIPTFRGDGYVCEVSEGAQTATPLTFLGSSLPEVFDHDQGNNGTFQLFLNGDHGVFEVTPPKGINEASFLIRVKNPAMLDYEKVKTMNFTIVAKETVPNNPKYSAVPVTVYIRDINDNFPEFTEPAYEVSVPENAPTGTTVAWIQAMDEDSGNFGTQGIRYTSVGGNAADMLHLDPVSGVLTVKSNDVKFDRELVSRHYLTVEARDDLGRGNRNTVQLTLNIEDQNDNAPEFALAKYEARLYENQQDFNPSLILHAEDADLNENSVIYYSVVGGNLQRNFTIDAESGRVRPLVPLDFERISVPATGGVRSMSLIIRAQDRGDPPLYSEVPLVVYLHDVNDHAPVFEKAHYTTSIAEDLPGGSPVIQVKAFDMDGSAPNNVIVYRLAGGQGDKFVMDAENGAISVAPGASLDPDRTDPKTELYALRVVALDGGIGREQKSAEVTVEVAIEDVNNKVPVFMDPGTIVVKENTPVGQNIFRVRALDVDAKPVLRYHIDAASSEARGEAGTRVQQQDYNYTMVFELGAVDGILRVARLLDREKVDIIRLALTVEDLAASRGQQTAFAVLTILVEDENDNNPVFRKPFYQQAITENSPSGVTIAQLVAEDADKNRTVNYSLEGEGTGITELVHLDPDTGELYVNSKIDRETYAWINLTVRATDSGIPPRHTFAQVFIQVLDENDNNPFFVGDLTNITVREDAPLGTEVARLQARDADSGDFGRITYLLDRRSSQGKFQIDPDTGIMNVSGPLNREESSFYMLIIEAWDNYQFGYITGESRNAFKQIGVHIVDVNDEAPVFEVTSGCASVTEFHPPGDVVSVVRAHDKDDPNTPNGRVVFRIEEGNDLGLFDISGLDYSSAKIYAAQPLKGLYGNYTLLIRAQDLGSPPNSATAPIKVCVTDFNDNPPRFVSPPHNFTVIVPENATIGTQVIEVRAIDDDIGANGAVRYRLRQDPLGHWRTFDIDHVSGIITLKDLLDRERQKMYEIRVEAYDLGIPTPLSSDLDLAIYVRNVNDFEPQFVQDEITVNFTENRGAGKERVRLVDTVDRDDIDLMDEPPPPVCYFLVGGNTSHLFDLDHLTHYLTVSAALDRESQAEHELIVRATESCLDSPSHVSEFDSRDDSLLRVRVRVLDVNDNAPRFIKRVFTGGVTTEADFGTEFMEVKAVDLDSPPHGNISYYMLGNVKMTLSEGLDNIKNTPFVVNRWTGAISLNFDPQKGMKGYFDFTVVANDSDNLQDTARVLIYLLREDQRVRFVLRQHPAEVREKIETFREVLGEVTGAIVNADEYKVHENRDGSVDKTRTDLYLHLVDRSDNSILDVGEALRRVDLNIEKLDALFKEFNVLDTQAAEAQLLRAEPETMMVLWLLGSTVFLGLMLIVTISICISQRARYLRQIKAATVAAFGPSQGDVGRVSASGRVPNTNMHSTEGSNPMWMQAYENEWFKEDEDDQRSTTSPTSEQDSLDENAVTCDETSTPPATNNWTKRTLSSPGTAVKSEHRSVDPPDDMENDRSLSTPPTVSKATQRVMAPLPPLMNKGNNKSLAPPPPKENNKIVFFNSRRLSNIIPEEESIKEQNDLNRGENFHQNLFSHLDKLSNPFTSKNLETTEL